MKTDNYKLEIPGGAYEFTEISDLFALNEALYYLHVSKIPQKGLKLFRYPKDWANRGGELIEVPFVLQHPELYGLTII